MVLSNRDNQELSKRLQKTPQLHSPHTFCVSTSATSSPPASPRVSPAQAPPALCRACSRGAAMCSSGTWSLREAAAPFCLRRPAQASRTGHRGSPPRGYQSPANHTPYRLPKFNTLLSGFRKYRSAGFLSPVQVLPPTVPPRSEQTPAEAPHGAAAPQPRQAGFLQEQRLLTEKRFSPHQI